MYYILNQNNQIIAADNDLLTLCEAKNIDDLYLQIIKNETSFIDLQEDNISIKTSIGDDSFSVQKTTLSSMLGDMTLVTLSIHEEKDITSNMNDEIIQSSLLKTEEESIITSSIEPTLDSIEVPLSLEIKEEEPFIKTEVAPIEDHSEITIDIDKISHDIGISSHDYTLFFNEFIDTALSLEKDLQDSNEEKYQNAITTLSHLSDALHLPVMQDAIKDIDSQVGDKKTVSIEAFYHTLSRLSSNDEVENNIEINNNTSTYVKEENNHTENEMIELFDDMPIITPEEHIEDTQEIKPSITNKSFGSIVLDDIEPKHFDFQLEEAANDLSLPVELIEEFVHDFIDQAHIETKKMLTAYEDGDLEAIQKIGHLLKGASSNLRITALSDTLYKIQFCEEPDNLETFIKDYWAHFLAFEKQINIISNT